MKNEKLSVQELRNSTEANFVIFWNGIELPTRKSGAINAKGGILLTAFVPELNATIEHRSNNNHGYKGFSFGDDKRLKSEIRQQLEYKY